MPKRAESMMWIVVVLLVVVVILNMICMTKSKKSEEDYETEVKFSECGATCAPQCTKLTHEWCQNNGKIQQKQQCECPVTAAPTTAPTNAPSTTTKMSGCGESCPSNCTEIDKQLCNGLYWNRTCQCPA